MSQNNQPYRFIHGVRLCKDGHSSAVVANLKHCETNESILKIWRNPQRPFWITKESLRNHKGKKEYAPDNELDMFICPEHELGEKMARALGVYYGPRENAHRLCRYPYVYGADIDVRVVLKQQLAATCPGMPSHYSISYLDIENVEKTGELVCVAFTDLDSRTCYVGITQKWMKDHTIEECQEVCNQKIKEFREQLNDAAKELFDQAPFTRQFRIFKDEVSLISAIFGAVHKHKPDFCFCWSGHDIKTILDRLNYHGVHPADIMAHPEVPPELRYCHYKEDNREYDHFTQKWHWLSLSGYTQFIDGMCAYSQLRTVKGKEVSYKLDYILSKNIGAGKIGFSVNDHTIMRNTRIVEYGVYCLFDTLGPALMEGINMDGTKLVNLSGHGLIDDFNKQTIQIKNRFYCYCRQNRMVPAAVSGNMKRDGDDQIHNTGGNVLPPNLTRNTKVAALKEADILTGIHKFVSDLDVAS